MLKHRVIAQIITSSSRRHLQHIVNEDDRYSVTSSITTMLPTADSDDSATSPRLDGSTAHGHMYMPGGYSAFT
ncbi:hypothetical protein PR202_gb29464 [Eleusine coracana subsp. coracana]|uniref:Uncharacterized protein n=1 Tax=Eleusine coracana subsp. coracana TaxID=191504 RepID=A0AAV5G0J4_ELECO|nr:hypothetical protein PR202_gb29464 [Eleusine coracana subsp. coracana]